MKVNWWKWGVLTAIAAAIFYGGWKCGGGAVKTVQIEKTDTVVIPGQVVIDTAYVPKPYKVEVIRQQEVVRYDTAYTPVIVEVEGKQTAYYQDTVKLDQGSITITDTVQGSRITGRRVRADLDIQVVTNTVALPKRSIGYFGLNVSGGPQNYLFSLGADLSLKTKNDRIYSVGVSLTRDNQILYGVGVRFPIRLR